MTENSIDPKGNSPQETTPELADDGVPSQQPPMPEADPVQPDGEIDDTERLHWLLICPPDNWKEPIPVSLAELRLLQLLTLRLDLVLSRDDKRKKVYLGAARGELGPAPRSRSTGDSEKGLAGGDTGGSSSASTGAKASNPSSPPRSGLRFPSRWTADVVPDKQAGPEYEPIDVEAAAPLVPAFPDAQISKNFRLSEFRCGDHNYDLIRISPKLVATLEEIRERAGGHQLHVTSGYRPQAYNRKVGGVSNSTHIDGLASDIYSDYLSTDELYDICDRVIGDKGGVGYYPVQGFIHVDIRGYRARW